MPRVPAVRRAELDPAGQSIYDEIAASRGPEFVRQGPFGVLLNSAELAGRAARLGSYVRYEGPMPSRHRHLLAMIVARELDCQFEFTAHAVLARKAGIPPEAVAAIGTGRLPEGLAEPETTVVRFVRQLVRGHRVDGPTFEALERLVGRPALTEIVAAVGYFAFAAHVLNAFDVEVRDDQEPELPPRE